MMKKYKCTNTECHYSCELRSDLFPHKCVCWDYIPQWVEMDETEPVTESNKLPKLTAEVFDREDCPDSPRYKACGNSMCVNVMRWIGMRIEMVERRMKGEDK